jgi:anion transporter
MSFTSSKWFHFAVAAILGATLGLMPAPHGLSHIAQTVLAVLAFTVVLWMFKVMNNGIASVLMMGLMILFGVKPSLVLSGFSAPSFWILLVVLFYGLAMQRTGLAKRISFYILSLFPGSYGGILAAFFVTGSILAMGIPSMTVRTAIMTPIAWALVQSLGLKPQSRGCALIMLTTVEMAVLPGCSILYGSLMGPVVVNVFQQQHLSLSWLGYAQAMALPNTLICVLVVLANMFLLKPEAPLDASPEFGRGCLKGMGPMGRQEIITAIVVAASIVYWATDRLHPTLPAFLIGIFGLAVFGLAGIVRDQDIAGGVSWTLMLFLGGIFGLQSVIQDCKLTDWLAGYLVPIAGNIMFSAVLIMIVLAIAMFISRFIDPSGFIAFPLLFQPISAIAVNAGIPPLILATPLVLASSPFWVNYQNIWIAMGDEITEHMAFTPAQRVRFANIYAIVTLVSLALAVPYWRLIGLL